MEDRSWTFDEETQEWVDDFGARYSIDRKTILSCPEDIEGKFFVPNSVVLIGDKAFYGCSNLKEIIIPDSVISIGFKAFMMCSKLEEIIIPDSVTSIGDAAFMMCSKLEEIIIPKSVTSIDDFTFFDCHKLKDIFILNRNALSNYMFRYHQFRPSIIFDEKKQQWVDRYGVHYSEDLETVEKCPEYFEGHYKILNGIKIIGSHAFAGCSRLESIIIPESVTGIGDCAFYGCSELRRANIPNNVVRIGNDAFAGCSRLESVCMPTSLSDIGKRAFAGCSMLEKIDIPQIDIIEDATFANCSSLKSVNFSHKESVKNIGKMAFSGCTSLVNIDLPDSVTKIEEKAFFDCSRLENIYNFVSTSVTSIEHDTFSKCSRLEKIELPCSVKNIDNYAFAWCLSLKGIIIPDGVTTIGNSAFYGCLEFREISIPNSVIEIGHEAFWGCPIKEVRLSPDTNYHPDSFSGSTKVVKAKVFISYSWDNEGHKDWVRTLAEELVVKGVYVILDQWDLELGALLPNFMEKSISEADKVIIIMTPNYKKKANKLVGGVGYEYSIITSEIFANIPTNKFIPVLKEGSFQDSFPTALSGRVSIDMRKDEDYEKGFEAILRVVFNKPKYPKPPLGQVPKFD